MKLVLWHESCKCVCKLNSSVCNNKQIWNRNTCRCDCNEDFAGMINCILHVESKYLLMSV